MKKFPYIPQQQHSPFFFSETVNSERYLEMLLSQFWPSVQQRQLQNDLIFMQDGAPAHWGTAVPQWLDNNLEGRWIGRGPLKMP